MPPWMYAPSPKAALASFAALACALPALGGELLVGAAASLREPAEACARAFEARHPEHPVRISYGASSVLAAQLRAGAPLDLLLLADARLAETLAGEGVLLAPASLARGELVVMVRPGARALGTPADLSGPDVKRIAVPEHAVPVGRYARQWLARQGLLEVLSSRIVPTEHARATLVAVDQGLVDAAIVYASDARLARRARVGWEIPKAEQPAIHYALALSPRGAEDPGAVALARFLASEPAREILGRFGFLVDGAP